MNTENFLKLELKIFSKAYDKENSKKYKGTAYYIIRKEDKKIVFRTLKLDEDQTIIEASNNIDGSQSEHYLKSERLKELKKYRLDSFAWINPIDKTPKVLTEFKGDIKYLNNLIIKSKATTKQVIGFLSGSHSSGELAQPQKGEAIVKFEDESLIKYFGEKSFEETENLSWKILPLLDNSDAISRFNTTISSEITWDDIDKIETISFEKVFAFNWKVIPWAKTLFEEDYVDFEKAVVSHNFKFFKEDFEKVDALLFDKDYFNKDLYGKIFNAIDKSNRNALKEILRATWTINVNKNIEDSKYNKDFVKGLSRFQRCHIIEQHDAIDKLMDLSIDQDDKIDYLNKLLHKENYLLLEATLHGYWDNSKSIIINTYGDIINNGLKEEEFETIVGKNKNIYSIYENSMSGERAMLFEYRGE